MPSTRRKGERKEKEEEEMPEGTGHIFPETLWKLLPLSKIPSRVQQHFCPYFRAGYSSAGQTSPLFIKTWKTILISSTFKVPSWAGAAPGKFSRIFIQFLLKNPHNKI